jgi:hypothetical protein
MWKYFIYVYVECVGRDSIVSIATCYELDSGDRILVGVRFSAPIQAGTVDLVGLMVSVLATGPKVRGFDPDRGRWIFKGDKNPEHNFLRKGSKAVGLMS